MRGEAGSEEEEIDSDGGESDYIDTPDELEMGLDLVRLRRPAVSDLVFDGAFLAYLQANLVTIAREIQRRLSRPRVSDVPWYAEATRRAIITRDHHARRRARIQRERHIERERQREERRIQREQLEGRQPYIDEMLAIIDTSFAIDTDFLSLNSTIWNEGQGPSSRADPPSSTIEQGRSQRSGAPGPEDRVVVEDRTAVQEHQRGSNEGNDSSNSDGPTRAWMEFVRSCRPDPQGPVRE